MKYRSPLTTHHSPLTTLLLALAFLLIGTTSSHSQEKVPKVAEFYPLRIGAEWHYRATAKTISVADKKTTETLLGENKKVVVRAVKEEPVEFEPDKKKQKVKSVILEITSDGRTLTEQVAIWGDGVYRLASGGKVISPALCFFKFQQSWPAKGETNGKVLKGTFTLKEEEVTVPKGTYRAYLASCEDFQAGDVKMSLKYWFAPGVGIVKQEVRVGPPESQVVSLLELLEFRDVR